VLPPAVPLRTPSRPFVARTVTKTFFGSLAEDEELERANQEFWRRLLGHLRAEVTPDEVQSVLDVGCHRGGLLELLARHFKPECLLGLEPLAAARQRALFRLKGQAPSVQILDPAQWPSVPAASVDLATCHEVLQLVGDLCPFLKEIARVLRPAGRAFVVLGCHTENPVWPRWKNQLIALGHAVFDHSPMEILRQASLAGFHTAVQPLRREGWVIYDPVAASFEFASVQEMLDHQYRHKLLFRFIKRNDRETRS
jgi:SAM-dependent methyltransferase